MFSTYYNLIIIKIQWKIKEIVQLKNSVVNTGFLIETLLCKLLAISSSHGMISQWTLLKPILKPIYRYPGWSPLIGGDVFTRNWQGRWCGHIIPRVIFGQYPAWPVHGVNLSTVPGDGVGRCHCLRGQQWTTLHWGRCGCSGGGVVELGR